MFVLTLILFVQTAVAQQEPPSPLVKALVEAGSEQEILQQLQQDPSLVVKPRTPKSDQKDPDEKAKAMALERAFGFHMGYEQKNMGQPVNDIWNSPIGAAHFNYGVSFRPPYKYLGRIRFEILREHHEITSTPYNAEERADGRHYIDPASATSYTVEYDVWRKNSPPGSYQDWFSDFGLSLGYYQGKALYWDRTDENSNDPVSTFTSAERGLQIRIRNMPWKEIMNSKMSGGLYFMSRISSKGYVSLGIGIDVQIGPKTWIKEKIRK